MNRTSPLPALLLAASLAGLAGCLSDSDDDKDPSGGSGTAVQAIGTYRVSGDTIFMSLPGDTSAWCFGDERKVEISEPSVDTTPIKVEGNTLTIYQDPEEHVDWEESGLGSTGIFIQTYSVLTRISVGTGVDGTWRLKENGYRVIQGTLTDDAREEWDGIMEAQTRFRSFGTSTLVLDAGKASGILDVRWADLFLASWTGEVFASEDFPPDSARYDAEVTKVDANTVRVKGNQTGETVTVEIAADGTESYASDKAGRKAYTADSNPETCPVEEWYEEEFLAANGKDAELSKRGAGPKPRPARPGPRPW